MLELSLALAILTTPGAGVVAANQSSGGHPSPQASPAPGQLLNSGHVTSTGQTVPQPGVSQSAGETQHDRSIERENDKIDNSICKGC